MIPEAKIPFRKDAELVDLRQAADTATRPPVAARAAASPTSGWRLWLRRGGVLVFVFVCATLGVMLIILPWRPEWTENPLLFSYPTLRAVISSGFARGAATGLGVLNVWIGFGEAIQYREE